MPNIVQLLNLKSSILHLSINNRKGTTTGEIAIVILNKTERTPLTDMVCLAHIEGLKLPSTTGDLRFDPIHSKRLMTYFNQRSLQSLCQRFHE